MMQIVKKNNEQVELSPLQICHLAWRAPRQRGVCKAPLSQSVPGETRQEKESHADGWYMK